MVPDSHRPNELATGLCKRHLWLHKWTRWYREQVITAPHGEVVFWWYRWCIRCGWSQSRSEVVARGLSSWPKHIRQ